MLQPDLEDKILRNDQAGLRSQSLGPTVRPKPDLKSTRPGGSRAYLDPFPALPRGSSTIRARTAERKKLLVGEEVFERRVCLQICCSVVAQVARLDFFKSFYACTCIRLCVQMRERARVCTRVCVGHSQSVSRSFHALRAWLLIYHL